MFEAPDSRPSPAGRALAAATHDRVPVVEAGFGHELSAERLDELLLQESLRWLDEPPGEVLAAAVQDVRARLADVSDEDVLRLVVATERVAAWGQAQQLEAIAELARRPGMNPAGRHALDGRSLTIGEIGPALGLTRHAATRRVDLAEHLAVELPDTLTALREGRIDGQRAQAISDELAATPELDAADRAVIEQDALARSATGSAMPCRRSTLRMRPHGTARPVATGGCTRCRSRTGWVSCGVTCPPKRSR
jgi:hypothetical protein